MGTVQMKLQIIEYKLSDLVNMCDRYRYTLELDGRLMLQFESMDVSLPQDYVTNKLMDSVRLLTDLDLEHYNRFNIDKTPGISKKILFEQEVSDHYLKDLKIQQRIKDIEGDFE